MLPPEIEDPTDLQGQARREAAADADRRLRKENLDSDWLWLMGGKRGRRIVRRLQHLFGDPDHSAFTPNGQAFAKADGALETGRWIHRQNKRLCPHLATQMEQEHASQ